MNVFIANDNDALFFLLDSMNEKKVEKNMFSHSLSFALFQRSLIFVCKLFWQIARKLLWNKLYQFFAVNILQIEAFQYLIVIMNLEWRAEVK